MPVFVNPFRLKGATIAIFVELFSFELLLLKKPPALKFINSQSLETLPFSTSSFDGHFTSFPNQIDINRKVVTKTNFSYGMPFR
jgi:hypothetical protein